MRLSAWILLTFAVGVAGCQAGGAPARPAARTARNIVVDAGARRQSWARGLRRDVAAGRYDRVDSLADSLRESHARWPNDQLELGTLYFEGFGDDLGGSESEDAWRAVIEDLEAWRAARPRSITAPVALAYAYTAWAWYARGSGAAVTVTKEGRRHFHERLQRAHEVLDEARALDARCPYWYSAALTVALGEGWPRASVMAVYRDGVAADPQCWILHDKMAAYLLPRWYGQPGEWEQFALEITRDLPAADRDALYAEVVRYLARFHSNIFEETDASWFRVHRGMDELRRRQPGSVEIECEYAKLATLAGDRDRARAAFERLDGKWDVSVWRSGKFYWGAYWWAMSGGPRS